jgi:hypothetical protein
MASLFGMKNTATFAHQAAGLNAAGENAIGYGWDCVIIPGAFGPTNSGGIEGTPATQSTTYMTQQPQTHNVMPNPWPPQICGNLAGLGTGMPHSGAIEAATMGTLMDTTDGVEAEGGSTIGNKIAETVSICTRATPFILEFMSDDLEGIGGESGHTEWEQITTGRGFDLISTQIAC